MKIIDRIICHLWGHAISSEKEIVWYKENLKNGSWKFNILQCFRCGEVHPATSFPVFKECAENIENT